MKKSKIKLRTPLELLHSGVFGSLIASIVFTNRASLMVAQIPRFDMDILSNSIEVAALGVFKGADSGYPVCELR